MGFFAENSNVTYSQLLPPKLAYRHQRCERSQPSGNAFGEIPTPKNHASLWEARWGLSTHAVALAFMCKLLGKSASHLFAYRFTSTAALGRLSGWKKSRQGVQLECVEDSEVRGIQREYLADSCRPPRGGDLCVEQTLPS